MNKHGLYIFVEGNDDERFLLHVYEQFFSDKHEWVKPYQYSTKKTRDVSRFIQAIDKMIHADYLFFADQDENPTSQTKIEKLLNKFRTLNEDKIEIVTVEIESWYIAGLSQIGAKQLNLSPLPKHTNDLTKEYFDTMMERASFRSRIDFMQELLKYFSIVEAREKNKSFDLFSQRYDENG